MAKYVISEMNQARVDIKSWASENIETLNSKTKNLEKMVQDESNSGELLDSIKKFASYDASGINALINGVETFDTCFGNATSAYNDMVGQDVDVEDLTRRINENKQLIKNYENQAASIKAESTGDKAGLLPFSESTAMLKATNFVYKNMIERFNNWNETHSNDLDGAIDLMDKANSVLTNLGKIPFDSKSGYDLEKVDLAGITTLDKDSWDKLLVAKGYVTSDGKITNEGLAYIKGLCTKDYDSVTDKEFTLATRLVLYADTKEEVEDLINTGYCNYNKHIGYGGVEVTRRETSECFKDIISTAMAIDYLDAKINYGSLSDREWVRLEENISSLAAIRAFVMKADHIDNDVTIVSGKGVYYTHEENVSSDLNTILGPPMVDYMYCGCDKSGEQSLEIFEKLQDQIADDINNAKNYYQMATSIFSFFPSTGLAGQIAKSVAAFGKIEKTIKYYNQFDDENKPDVKIDDGLSFTMVTDVTEPGSQYVNNFKLHVLMADGQTLAFPSKDTTGAIEHFNDKMKTLKEDGIKFYDYEQGKIDNKIADAGFNKEEDVSKTIDETTGEITYKFKTLKELDINDFFDKKKTKLIRKESQLFNGLDEKGDFDADK